MTYAVKVLYVYGDWVFKNFPVFQISWRRHSRSKICKTTGKSGLKFCKLIFIAGDWANCLQIF